MFLFAHLGIGSKIVSPFTRGLPRKAVFFGAILPDLIDKPLYYLISWVTGKQGDQLELIRGTHTIGHTGIALLILTLFAIGNRSRTLAAIALGVASHLLLDSWSATFHTHTYSHLHYEPFYNVLLWPVFGWQFPPIPYRNISEHLGAITIPFLLWGEIIGILLLSWDYWKKRHHIPT